MSKNQFSCHTIFTQISAVVLISFFVSPVQPLFEGDAYLKGSYHKDETILHAHFSEKLEAT